MAWNPTNWNPPNWYPPNWTPPESTPVVPPDSTPTPLDACGLVTFKSLLNAGEVVFSRFNDRHHNFAKAECLIAEVWVTLDNADGVFSLTYAQFKSLTKVQQDRIRNTGASVTML